LLVITSRGVIFATLPLSVQVKIEHGGLISIPSKLSVGDTVPDFTLPAAVGGESVTLSNVLGEYQYVVLALFRAYY
jgi:hypothetical protein